MILLQIDGVVGLPRLVLGVGAAVFCSKKGYDPASTSSFFNLWGFAHGCMHLPVQDVLYWWRYLQLSFAYG